MTNGRVWEGDKGERGREYGSVGVWDKKAACLRTD
jgi:hypothetical protein